MPKNNVKAIIIDGFGLNCGYETKYSFELAGAEAERVHLTDLIERRKRINDYHIFVPIGGFADGDELGAGVVLANRFRDYLREDLTMFIEDNKLIIGICNGFQAIAKSGLLPGFGGNYDERSISVTYNDCGNFIDQWVTLKVNPDSNCVFTKDIEYIDLPIRHGQGKVMMSDETREKIKEQNQIVMQYCLWQGKEIANGKLPDNPNGSLDDIAGICDETGRIFGLMPHPEAYNHWTNHILWTKQKHELQKRGLQKPENEEGAGIKIFRNAVEYVKENLL